LNIDTDPRTASGCAVHNELRGYERQAITNRENTTPATVISFGGPGVETSSIVDHFESDLGLVRE
jgi:hypothetical protein